jgi:hypothetical protein
MKLTQLTQILLLTLPTLGSAANNISPTDKYAWSTHAGWVNFLPTNGGVTVAADHLEGYAWAENVGWLRLGTYTSGGNYTYGNTSATDYGVNIDASGNCSGYAWSTNAGWINFKPTNGGVTVDLTTGRFDGYAWSENVGWIHFQNASPAYNVRYEVPPTVVLSASATTGTEANQTVITVTATASLQAYDAATGQLLWSTSKLPGQTACNSAPTATGGIVYTSGSGSGGLFYAVLVGGLLGYYLLVAGGGGGVNG